MAQQSNNESKNNEDLIEALKKQLQDTFDETKKSREDCVKMEQELEDDYQKRLQLAELFPHPKNADTFRKSCEVHKWLIYNNIHMNGIDESSKIWWSSLDKIPFVTNPKKSEDQTPEYKEITNYIKQMKFEWLEKYFPEWVQGNDARRKFEKLPDTHK